MRKRLALTAAIITAATPLAVAHATTGTPAARPATAATARAAAPAGAPDSVAAHALPRVTNADLRSATATRALSRSRAAHVLRARQAAGSVVVVVAFGPGGDDAVPINDVNHDGAQDVLQARLSVGTPAVVVLSGASGRALWSVPTAGLLGAEYAAVPGGAGVVLVYSSGPAQDAPGVVVDAGEWSFVVTALDAATGRSVWSHSFPATWAFGPTGGAMTGVEPDALLARRGQAPLLLLTDAAFGDALVAGGMVTHPLLLDVGTGQAVGVSAPAVSDGFVYSEGIGDVDADGTDDVATISDGDLETVSVWSGASGQPLWSTSYNAGFIGYVGASPDIDGDKSADLLVGVEGATPSGTVEAVTGRSGTLIWQHSGDYATAVGDVDHDGRSDTRVVRFGQTMSYAVVNAKGKELWRAVIPSHFASAFIPVSYPAGDVNGDGVSDIYLRYIDKPGLFGVPVAGAGSVLVDGATGHLRRLPDLGVPLGDTADGRGADFYRAVQAKGGLVTSVIDGRTAHVLWRRTLHGTAHMVVDSSIGLFGSRPTRQILSAVDFGDHELVLTQVGRSGTTGWSTSYALNQDDGFASIG